MTAPQAAADMLLAHLAKAVQADRAEDRDSYRSLPTT